MAQNNDVDVNTLIKVYNSKISTLTNQNILLEAKLQNDCTRSFRCSKRIISRKT